MVRQIRFLVVLLAGLALLAVARADAQGRTFYISYSSGSNSNPGTQSAPWKTHPYMSSGSACTGTGSAPSYTHQAGDHFIFRGGETWPSACLPLTIKASGTSGAIDYYGVDQSWYSGISWKRPLFDANYKTVNNMVNASGITYITLDNLELAHQGITPSATFSTASCGIFFGQTTWGGWKAGTTVENVYLHDWAVTSNLNAYPANNFDNVCVGGIVGAAEVSGIETSDANGYAYINGTKTNGLMGGGVAFVGELKNSKIHDGWNGCTTSGSCHDTEFYHIEQSNIANYTGVHSQVIEDNEPCPSTTGNSMPTYNNVIHDNGSGVNIFIRYFSPVYNNVMWNNTNNYAIRLCVPTTDSSSHAGYVLNNTIDVSGSNEGGTAVGVTGSSAVGTLYIANNIIVNGSSSFGISAASEHYSNNYAMPAAEAITYGLASLNLYAPISADSNIVNKGSNLSGSCSGSMKMLCSDAQGAFWYGGSYQPRPTGTSAWTLGAYVVGGQSAAHPNAPTGLVATVQ
ncbi:MAG TPA: hypothetical protein VJR26_05815 [Candidatus Acidoferrales bacterium]|nr:hypothetical protein [Candidatus Acidoferrales bacterium]